MCHSVGVSRTSSPSRVDDPLRREVDGEVGGDDHRLLLGRRGAAQRGAQPGEQLVHAERLGHVVVGAGVERGDLVRLRLAHRQHDDRAPGSSPRRPWITSTPSMPGQPEVEDDDVGMVTGRELERLLARLGEVDVVAAGPQVDRRARAGSAARRRRRAPRLIDGTAGQARATIVMPPPGVSSTSARRPSRRRSPRATARPRPTPVPLRRVVAEPLERLEDQLALVGRDPGPWSMTRRSTRSPTAPASTRTALVRRATTPARCRRCSRPPARAAARRR